MPIGALEFREHDTVVGHHDRRRCRFRSAQIAHAGCERDQHEHVKRHQRGQRDRDAVQVPLCRNEAAKPFDA
jgi:hypothetical protein